MANPNIVNATSIYVSTTYLIPTGITATTWTGLTPSANSVTKMDSLTATNVTNTAATITVSINNATGGSGTAYRIAYQLSIPGNTSLMLVDKGNPLYIGESQSVVVTSGTNNAIELVASIQVLS
jgi:hypothetical protein